MRISLPHLVQWCCSRVGAAREVVLFQRTWWELFGQRSLSPADTVLHSPFKSHIMCHLLLIQLYWKKIAAVSLKSGVPDPFFQEWEDRVHNLKIHLLDVQKERRSRNKKCRKVSKGLLRYCINTANEPDLNLYKVFTKVNFWIHLFIKNISWNIGVYWLYDLLNIHDTLWGPPLCHDVRQWRWLPWDLEQWSGGDLGGKTEIHWPGESASLASLLTGIDGVSMFPDFFLSPSLSPCSGPFFLFSSVSSSSRHQSIAIICSYPSPVMQAPAFSAHQKEDKREEVYYQIVLPFLDAFFITNLKLISFNELHDMAFTLW